MTPQSYGLGRTVRDVSAHLRLAAADRLALAPRARVPEPMVVDDPDEVARFGEGGAGQPAMRSVYEFSARALSALTPRGGCVIDLGVGSGHALAHFLRGRPDTTAVGVDLSKQMLGLARTTFEKAAVADRVRLEHADITALPYEFHRERVDAVSALWTLHQLPDDETAAEALKQIAVLHAEHGAAVWLFDFQRLASPATLPAVFSTTEPGYPAQLRADAIRSEAAAFTDTELLRLLATAGLGRARCRTSTPLRLFQAAWLPTASRTGARPDSWHPPGLDAESARKAALLQRAFSASPARPHPRDPYART